MHVRLVIDAIVRQTTVLIAQLATSAGMRAPLAQIANQTFLSLTHELVPPPVCPEPTFDVVEPGEEFSVAWDLSAWPGAPNTCSTRTALLTSSIST